jgi:hypothetical protein
MLAPLSQVHALVAAIRRELGAQLPQRAGEGGRPRAARQLRGGTAALIRRRIAGIAPDDPARAHKVLRLFLESVLVAEFGEAMLHDPRFFALVDTVQERMESEAALRPLIAEAVAQLLNGRR